MREETAAATRPERSEERFEVPTRAPASGGAEIRQGRVETVARRNRRKDQVVPPPRPTGAQGREEWRGEDYLVRTVTGSAAVKSYRCPGCDQLVLPGRPHLVVWPDLDLDAGNRRHWHAACWAARERRAPGMRRGRAAPRY